MTFLKSTQKWLLKNVQDGISRTLGSREIQKAKVGTVLPDTLYLISCIKVVLDKVDVCRPKA